MASSSKGNAPARRSGMWTIGRAAALLAMAALIAAAPAERAGAAETRLDRTTRAAVNGDRAATRAAAKIIAKRGPQSFRDAARIRPLLRAEAARGSSAAANAYGMMLQYGIGGEARPGEAASWYGRGSQRGNVSAAKKGAVAYALGWGVRRDTGHALKLLARVPQDQRAHRMLEIAKALMQEGRAEPELALAWLKRAEQNDPKGMLNSAETYRRIAELEPKRAPELRGWLQPAIDKGNGRAALVLARRLEGGDAADQKAAAGYYLVAAGRNEEDAFEGLGRLLTTAAPDTLAEIRAFLEQKAGEGVASASAVLANLYLFQPGTEANATERGIAYLRAAAEKGDPQAQYRFAMMLLGNAGDPAQYQLARAYLALSAAHGNAQAGVAVAALGETLPVAEAEKLIAAQPR